MVLVIVVGALAFLYFRQDATRNAAAESQKAAQPTASPTTGGQGVTGNGDFASILALINEGLKTTDHIISTTVQKN